MTENKDEINPQLINQITQDLIEFIKIYIMHQNKLLRKVFLNIQSLL